MAQDGSWLLIQLLCPRLSLRRRPQGRGAASRWGCSFNASFIWPTEGKTWGTDVVRSHATRRGGGRAQRWAPPTQNAQAQCAAWRQKSESLLQLFMQSAEIGSLPRRPISTQVSYAMASKAANHRENRPLLNLLSTSRTRSSTGTKASKRVKACMHHCDLDFMVVNETGEVSSKRRTSISAVDRAELIHPAQLLQHHDTG